MFDSDEEPISDPSLGSYQTVLETSRTVDFSDFEERPLIQTLAKDLEGRPAIVITPICIGADSEAFPRSLRYAVRRLDPILSRQDYIVIACFSQQTWAVFNDPGFVWLKTFFALLPRLYRKRLKKLYFIHPTATTQAALTAWMPFIGQKFWSKYVHVDRLSTMIGRIMIPEGRVARYFPHIVQVEEAQIRGEDLPPVFGVALDDLAGRQGLDVRGCKAVPEALVMMVAQLERREVIITRDLFAQQPEAPPLYTIIAHIDNGNWSAELTENVPALATALRVFLGSLDEPLFGDRAFSTFARLIKEEEAAGVGEKTSRSRYASVLRSLIGQASFSGAQTTKYLLTFFDTVTQRQRDNMMTAKKLAECFAPVFLKPKTWDETVPQLLPAVVEAIALLISEPTAFFRDVFSYLEKPRAEESVVPSPPLPAHAPPIMEGVTEEEEEEETVTEESEPGGSLPTRRTPQMGKLAFRLPILATAKAATTGAKMTLPTKRPPGGPPAVPKMAAPRGAPALLTETEEESLEEQESEESFEEESVSEEDIIS